MPRLVITKEIETYIADNYLKISQVDIAKHFGIPKGTVTSYYGIAGITLSRAQSQAFRNKGMRKPITTKEIQYIHDNIQAMSINSMSKQMHRTGKLIGDTAHSLGYSEIIEQRAIDSRLKKGHTPLNKGLKQSEYMSAEMIERTKATRFKAGHKPHNTLVDGDIKLRNEHADRAGGRQYLYYKISDGNWIQLHRHLWQLAFGPIPEGMNIIFKDGDTLNCVIGNLEMIDNAENMSRNTIQNYPTEIKSNIRLVAKLQRKIQDHEQHNGTK